MFFALAEQVLYILYHDPPCTTAQGVVAFDCAIGMAALSWLF